MPLLTRLATTLSPPLIARQATSNADPSPRSESPPLILALIVIGVLCSTMMGVLIWRRIRGVAADNPLDPQDSAFLEVLSRGGGVPFTWHDTPVPRRRRTKAQKPKERPKLWDLTTVEVGHGKVGEKVTRDWDTIMVRPKHPGLFDRPQLIC